MRDAALDFIDGSAFVVGHMMPSPLRPGDVVAGKYRVERVLGRGGMGVVVAARHLRLRERVAIKFLLARPGAGEAALARFVREGRAAMRIRSEHVVRVHDIGTLATGEPFLVMEYLEGSDLAAVVARDGPLPVEAAVEYVLQAVEALAEAHARGIVHRDLKPANLFLARRADGSPLVKVLDFGIAKDTLPEASSAVSFGVLGTPLYMAPEQMRSGLPVDARTDIWALGVTLHALLTGAPPFRAGSLVEIHEHIQRGAAPLRTLRPEAPAALEAALLRCMEKDPARRYADVAALAEALAEVALPAARISVQRAARILAAAPLAKDTTDPAGAEEDAESTAGADTVGLTDSAASPSWHDAEPGSATTGSPAGASLPVAVDPVPRSPPRWRRALAGAGAVGGLVALAAILHRASPAPASVAAREIPSAPAPSSSTPPEPPTPAAAEGAGDAGPPGQGSASTRSAARSPDATAPARARPGEKVIPRPPGPEVRTSRPAHPAARDPLADPD